ncbi:hypothetical protein BGW41_000819 [Actinomortierella wolfii]|nr:hypothetical protein BGW41_000819 [Actinomortierella wolfii]
MAVRAAAGSRPPTLIPFSKLPNNTIFRIPSNAPCPQSFRALTLRSEGPLSLPTATWQLASSPAKDSVLLPAQSNVPLGRVARSSRVASTFQKPLARKGAQVWPWSMSHSTLGANTCINSTTILSRSFHSTRPSRMAAPLLPVVFSVLKTPMTAAVLRILSRISLTLLPLSTRRSPRVILTLVMIPPICFGLVIAAGLETAPNTGRWRFLFTSEEAEFELIREELPALLATLRIVEDENDPRVKLVRHILNNLLKHAIEPDGTTLRSFNIQDDENRDALLAQLAEDGEDGNANILLRTYGYHSDQNAFVNTLSRDGKPAMKNKRKHVQELNKLKEDGKKMSVLEVLDDPNLEFKNRPFQIFVTEDDEINACSVGPPRLIFINSGLMEFVDNDEDMLAAVIAHEVAHVIQRHTMETHGRETIMLFLADILRSALWTVSIPLGPWLNSWIDQTTESLLHFTASGPLHQSIEVEADTVSLSLMAMAGYDPIHAVRFWEEMSEVERKQMELENSVEVHRWTDWMYDHPPSAERAKYMKEQVVGARELWKKVLKLRDEPVARFGHALGSSAKVDEDGDLIEGTADAVLEQLDEDIKDMEAQARREGEGWFSTVKGWFFFHQPRSEPLSENLTTLPPRLKN